MKERCSNFDERGNFCDRNPTELIAVRDESTGYEKWSPYYFRGLPVCEKHAAEYRLHLAKKLHALRIRETLNLLRTASNAKTPWQALMFAAGIAYTENAFLLENPQIDRALYVAMRVEKRRLKRGHG
jgi:hypothetical protein